MKKLLLFLVSLSIIFPGLVKAATYLEGSTGNPVVGSSLFLQLVIDYNKDYEIRDYRLKINYDPDFFEFENLTWMTSGSNTYNVDKKDGVITINKANDGIYWSGSMVPLTVNMKVKKSGSTKITLSRNGENHFKNGNIIPDSFAGMNVSPVEPDNNTLINKLYVEGYTLSPTFSKTKYDYYLTVPADVTSVNVVGVPQNKKQTITGTGKRDLQYGTNKVHVVVKAQTGATATYEIVITRQDNRTGDVTLKFLTASNTNISYEEGKTEYKATVSRDISTTLIAARTTDPNAVLTGTGNKALEFGDNVFTLKVESAKGKVGIYTITINRSREDIQTAKTSSKLISLKVNSIGLDLANNQTKFLCGTSKDYDKLNINTITESTTSKVDIEGNENLKSGINPINIKVTETNNEVTEYKLLLYKNPTDAELITNLSEAPSSGNIVYNTTQEKTMIPSKLMSTINKSRKLYYNNVNLYNGLLYGITLSSNSTADLDLYFKKISDGPLTYQTTVPENNNIKLYVGDIYADNIDLKVYSYSEIGKYNLVTAGVKIKDGYIDFSTNGDLFYVISTTPLLDESGPFMKIINKYKMYIIGGFAGLLLLIVIIHQANKKKKTKNQEEPSY
jgi:hypothetical protein